MDVQVLGLADPVDGLFAVRVIPCPDTADQDRVWARLSLAALALGPAETEDVGLLRVATPGGSVYVDALDRTIEIHPRAL